MPALVGMRRQLGTKRPLADTLRTNLFDTDLRGRDEGGRKGAWAPTAAKSGGLLRRSHGVDPFRPTDLWQLDRLFACPEPKVRLAAGVPRSAASDLRDPLKSLVRPTWPAICVRGTDPFGHFGEQQLPDFVNEKKTV